MRDIPTNLNILIPEKIESNKDIRNETVIRGKKISITQQLTDESTTPRNFLLSKLSYHIQNSPKNTYGSTWEHCFWPSRGYNYPCQSFHLGMTYPADTEKGSISQEPAGPWKGVQLFLFLTQSSWNLAEIIKIRQETHI